MSLGPRDVTRAGTVRPTDQAAVARRPLGHDAVTLEPSGWLGHWQRLNREATLPHCLDELEATGTVDNFRNKTGEATGGHRGMWFADSDIYKTLEGVGWERAGDARLRGAYDSLTALLAEAQDDDGYLHTWWGTDGRPRWEDLTHGHELYCAGHLIQAGVAAARGGDRGLLAVATRFADLVVDRFGERGSGGGTPGGGRTFVDGHPEIEMALVELWRETGTRAYLDLAGRMLAQRGHGTLGPSRFGAAYYQDHVPVREATAVTGHAVRQLYLLCGAVDVAVETGDGELLAAVERLWDDAFSTKTYLTGGHGSRHRDEAFGDPYELPPDRAYNETCAAIASVMCNWRLLLATGRRRYADEMERALYNAVAVGLSADGTRFFYSNPLQLRAGHDGSDEDSPSTRLPWYTCACCPPNLGRLGASLHHYVATGGGSGVELHLYAPGRIRVELDGGPVELAVETGYPWQGRVAVRVVEAPAGPWRLALRRPGWCDEVRVAGADLVDDGDGYLAATRPWRTGDVVELDLAMPVRAVRAHPAVDAVRGCVGLQRGPLVYCLEQGAQPGQLELDDLTVDLDRPVEVVEAGDGTVALTGTGRTGAARGWNGHLYGTADRGAQGAEPVTWVAGAYHRWANGPVTPMRVWVPVARS